MREIIRKDTANEAIILFFGQKARVGCDRKCIRAWGRNYQGQRLKGNAPENPGTYEGGIGKPASPNEFPQKWCIRECERCVMSSPGEWGKPLNLLP